MSEEKKTSSQIKIPIYLEGTSIKHSNPGKFPFTRGVHETMYRSKLWTMRQYAGFGDAKESNQRYHQLLKSGSTGLSVAFDLPTQMGYDADDPMAHGEVGRTGVSVSTMDDMRLLLHKIPLEKVSISMTINSTASILLSMVLLAAKEQKVSWDKLRGTIQNDLLKEYIARGTYIYPINHSLRLITDIFKFCSHEVPQWNTISVSGYHIREAGATAVQELAFTLANGLTYVDAAIKKGLQLNDFVPRISFFFNSHNNFFEEIAKFRAARKLWATLLKERFPEANDKSTMLRFHTQTGGSTLTAQQTDNNVVRVAYQALSAVLGGTQSLHTNGKDEALALPTEENARLALRTQQVIAYETGVADTVDPLAGSYYVEYLTDELFNNAKKLIEEIESRGGVITSIEDGFIPNAIADSAYIAQKRIESKEDIVVGVNDFKLEEEDHIPLQKISAATIKRQVTRLKAYKKKRKAKTVTSNLEKLKAASKGSENLVPVIISCLENSCTLGEISHALRETWGTFKQKY